MSQAENISAFKMDGSPSPGQLLLAARQAQQLTQIDVANKLRLSEQYIKDLELDDYTHIGARIYVRGYLLNYAKLLGIDTDEMLQAIQSTILPDENISMQRMLERNSTPINIRLHPQGYEKRSLSKWIGGIFVILLIALVIAWWQNQKTHFYSNVQMDNSSAESPKDIKTSSNEQNITLTPAVVSSLSNSNTPVPSTVGTSAILNNKVSGNAGQPLPVSNVNTMVETDNDNLSKSQSGQLTLPGAVNQNNSITQPGTLISNEATSNHEGAAAQNTSNMPIGAPASQNPVAQNATLQNNSAVTNSTSSNTNSAGLQNSISSASQVNPNSNVQTTHRGTVKRGVNAKSSRKKYYRHRPYSAQNYYPTHTTHALPALPAPGSN